MDGLERAYALVDELYLRIKEIHKEWEDAKVKFSHPVKENDDDGESDRFSPPK